MKDDRLNLYKSLFKGREDVFALRWEKASDEAVFGSKSNPPAPQKLKSPPR